MKNLLIALSLLVLFTTCSSDEKNARIEVWLTDGPGDYEEVNIDVQGVEIHSSDGEQNSGWITLDANAGIYNLLELTNGLDTLIGSLEIPAGRISQLRLKLGSNNTVTVGGEIFNLSTPSGQQSGLKIQIHQVLQEGVTYKILLDFDVARSVVTKGNGGYSLKPVIRSIVEAQSGAIKGMVDPVASTPAIYAIIGEDTLGTTYSDDAGKFLLRGLPAGTYKVVFSPNADYQLTTEEDVSVTLGSVTDMGTIEIPEQ